MWNTFDGVRWYSKAPNIVVAFNGKEARPVIINYKRSFLKVEEIWGRRKAETVKKADILLKKQLLLSEPENSLVKWRGNRNSLEVCVPNFLIDLSQDEEKICQKIHKSTRADIRKAIENAELTYYETDHPTDEEIMEFSLLYNSFAKKKNITPCFKEQLLAIRNNNSLIMTSVKDQQNNILCAGTLLQDRENKQLYGLYGVSKRLLKTTNNERRLIGRANKYLHWREIQSAKKRGMDWYNFGGEVFREEDKGVNDFKRRFGAIRGYDYNIFTPKSIIGKICVHLLYHKWKKNFNSNQSKSNLNTGSSAIFIVSSILQYIPLVVIV